MKNYDDAVGKVDSVIITARHGDNHYKYAKPYLASKKPEKWAEFRTET